MNSSPSLSHAQILSGIFRSESEAPEIAASHASNLLIQSALKEDPPQIFLISLKAVCKKINRGRSSVYLLMNKKHKAFDFQFPEPVRNGRRIAFVESEINAWLAEQIRASREAQNQ